jgi:hypothetical protein
MQVDFSRKIEKKFSRYYLNLRIFFPEKISNLSK